MSTITTENTLGLSFSERLELSFTHGSGSQVWDEAGRAYLDFTSGWGVTCLGHSHPVVVAAINAQAQRLMQSPNAGFTYSPERARLLRTLQTVLPSSLVRTYFCNSGAEANEAAIKLARKFGGRGRHVVVSALGSFHGRTLAALAATGQPAKHEPFQPMPEGFRHVAFGDLEAMAAAIDPSCAAVLIETVQGEGGVIPASPEYLRGLRALCDERGMLLMVDEVQTGYARTGEWFGFQHAGIAPDVVTMAKGIGNGFPVGAAWARRDVAAVFQPGDHGSTYSGTAIAGAAVSAVIAEMRRIDAPALAREKGEYFAQKLAAVDGVKAVRGQGLLRAAELGPGRDAKAVYTELLNRGLVTNAVNATSLRLAPPITTPFEHFDEAANLIAEVLAEGVGL